MNLGSHSLSGDILKLRTSQLRRNDESEEWDRIVVRVEQLVEMEALLVNGCEKTFSKYLGG